MNNKKKMPFFIMAALYVFLFLGILGGFFALGLVVSYVTEANIFLVLFLEIILLLISAYLLLNYISNFDELEITFSEEDDDDKDQIL